MYIKKFNSNEEGKDYVVGDLHGCYNKLYQKLQSINFNYEKDRLFSVGDLCDRGPDSKLILQLLSYDWFHPVMGNHEQILFLYENGAWSKERLISVGAGWWLDLTDDIKKVILAKFINLPLAIEVINKNNQKIGILHAECPVADWNKLPEAIKSVNSKKFISKMLWGVGSPHNNVIIKNVEAICVGHMVQENYDKKENIHLIDTGAYKNDGFFTLFDIDNLMPV